MADEANTPIRGIRAGDAPPNAYDDISYGDYNDRCWKGSRTTRWRRPAVSWKAPDGQAPGRGGAVL